MANKRTKTRVRSFRASNKQSERQAANELIAAALTCKQEFLNIDSRFQSKLRQWLGSAYGIAFELYRNGAAWRKFTKEDLWKGRRKRPRGSQKSVEDALIWTMRFLLSNGQADDQYHRAYTYARGLQQFFNRGVKPDEIPDLIKKHGGIEALSREAPKRGRKQRDSMASDTTFYADLADDPEQEDHSNEGHSPPRFRPKERAVLAQLETLKRALVSYLRDRVASI
ncbi:hypothetical protein [Microvirga antarctica]|uniref:hypothetical protein n=1 Tax=Microvirga antarctica TaxID=2819233 RepID=UPI001B30952D|nr:hypothetical protein [Microvirga antarctica]